MIQKGIIMAILAATFYAIGIPFSKIMLQYIPETLMAGFLYLGAGVCMAVIALIRKSKKTEVIENKLTKKEIPYTVAMIVLDIAAPICLLIGMKTTMASTASLLNNFEIVVTAVIALMFFKEKISSRLWLGIIFVTISCIVLSVGNILELKFSSGAIFILMATIFWGIENNCTRKLSSKDPMQIVMLKGIFSGGGSLIIGLVIGERTNNVVGILVVLLIGAIAYGMSIYVYIYAQRILGAARTSTYYAVSPFIGTALSLLIFKQKPEISYWIGLILMIVGAYFASSDKPIKLKLSSINKYLKRKM